MLVSFRIDWFDLIVVQRTVKSFLQHHSSKPSLVWHSAFYKAQLSHPYMTTGKTLSLTIQIFVSKVMSLLFSILSNFVIAFCPRNKHLLISWLQSQSLVILEPKIMKSDTISIFPPSTCHEVMGQHAMIFVFECWVLSQLFHSPLSPSRGSVVPLCFMSLEWYHLCIWGYYYFSWQSWFQLVSRYLINTYLNNEHPMMEVAQRWVSL